jgi:acyl-CoA synthetase (AMP-forming)/AMP-acid ligase II
MGKRKANDVTHALPGSETLGEIVERNLALYRDKEAIVFEGRSFTYGEFCGRAYRLANALYDLGLKRQARVAILAQNSNAYIETYTAGEVAGYVTVAVNYRLAAPEILYILKDAGPTALIFDAEYADLVGEIRDQIPNLQHLILIGRPGQPSPDWASDYETVLEGASPGPPPIRAEPDDIAYIIYTSGTTGHPKGAMLDHKGQVGFTRSNAIDYGARPTDRILLVMPFYHIGAKCSQLTYVLLGGTVILHRSYDIQSVARSIERDRATVAHLAPIMVQDLVDLAERETFDHSSLGLVLYASGPMSVAQLRRAVKSYGRIFLQVYGMTESGSGTILHTHEHILDGTERQQRRLSSAGQAATGYKIRVVRDDGSACEPEERGEILVSGPGLMRGYWNNHRATLEALEDGWMHTGDIGLLDEDGFLYVLDRKKDMILSGGENIYPREVEEAIYAHPAVFEVAVVGVPDERWGEAVKAFVVLRDDLKNGEQPVNETDIIEHCRQLIASYKKPKSVEFMGALPRLPNKKIDKKQLRAAFWEGRDRGVN